MTDIKQEDENVPYIQPSIEGKLSKEKRDEVHLIVQEVKNFGVSQRQLLYLIYHLALNLEKRDVMLAITQAVNEKREEVPVETIVKPKVKLITSEAKPAQTNAKLIIR